MKIDLNKKYRYRNGEPARILCVDAPGEYPVIAIGSDGDPTTHNESGQFFPAKGARSLDLIEVREPLECWVRVRDDIDEVDEMFSPNKEQLNPKWRLFREVID